MSRTVGFALALVALLGLGYVLLSYLRTAQTPVLITDAPSELRATTAVVNEENDTYKIDVQYPQFSIAAIDADIKSKVEASVAEFETLPGNPPESATPQNEFTGTFEDVYVGFDVISLKLIFSQYTGGAHPITLLSGLTYDRATGRQLLQNDAFAMIGLTVDEVSQRATDELKEKLGDSFFEEGADSNPENFSSFTISEDSVTFIFQPYQVGPYAAGPQEVSFSRVR